MPRLFAANFDFEHRLGPHPAPLRFNVPAAGYRLSKPNSPTAPTASQAAVERINRELAAVWVAVADEGDSLWLPGKIEPEFFTQLAAAGLPVVNPAFTESDVKNPVEVCPWGWTNGLRDWAKENDWIVQAPPQTVIDEANSRRFSAGLERSWGQELKGTMLVDRPEQFLAALQSLPAGYDHWVVKAEFSMSARERILGQGRRPNEAAVNWVAKRLQRDGVVCFEPWVERIEEAGLQFTIPWSGPPLFEGIATLLTDESGQYRGSRFSLDVDAELRWMPAVETGMRVAHELQQRGYFGPLGIDALRYRDDRGTERLRSLQDINARHTMGRLSLGFRRLLAPGEQGTWLYVRWPDETAESPARWLDTLRQELPPGVRIIPTTPNTVDNHPTRHGSLVVIAPTAAALRWFVAAAERVRDEHY